MQHRRRLPICALQRQPQHQCRQLPLPLRRMRLAGGACCNSGSMQLLLRKLQELCKLND